jgi:hypothetical protein
MATASAFVGNVIPRHDRCEWSSHREWSSVAARLGHDMRGLLVALTSIIVALISAETQSRAS